MICLNTDNLKYSAEDINKVSESWFVYPYQDEESEKIDRNLSEVAQTYFQITRGNPDFRSLKQYCRSHHFLGNYCDLPSDRIRRSSADSLADQFLAAQTLQ
jgi:hypothetical protein